ncbi:hypothetical protein D3C71_50690 [compost metagenome]
MARKQEIPWLKVAGIGLASLFGMRLYNKYIETLKANQPANTGAVESTGTGTNTVKGVTETATINTVLAKGSRGDMVALLQKTINSYLPSNYTRLVPDGVFGAKTEAALSMFWGVKSASVQWVKDKGVTAAISVYNGSGSTSKTPTSFQDLMNKFYSPGAGEESSDNSSNSWLRYFGLGW